MSDHPLSNMPTMRLTIIVAIARNRAIGFQNRLLYWLPNDLRRFKSLTVGNTVIMGSNTFRSLPNGALPNRRNIVLSRRGKPADFPGADLFRSLPEALADCQQRAQQSDAHSQDVFIIGGASVYREALPFADRLCLTCIDDTPSQADTFFPDFDSTDWLETFREAHTTDERHAHPYSFVDLERRR